jgi:hypothetical protein
MEFAPILIGYREEVPAVPAFPHSPRCCPAYRDPAALEHSVKLARAVAGGSGVQIGAAPFVRTV